MKFKCFDDLTGKRIEMATSSMCLIYCVLYWHHESEEWKLNNMAAANVKKKCTKEK